MQITRVRTVTSTVVVAGVLLLGSCGGSDSGSADDGGGGEKLTATTEDGGSTTTSTAASPDEPTIEGASLFVDPQGLYTIEISPEWADVTGTIGEDIEAWHIGIGTEQFQDNVNVLVQDAQGMDLEEYLDFSTRNAGGLEELDRQLITGANGNDLALLEYQGTLPSAPIPLHALVVFGVAGDQAVVATLTADQTTFAEARAAAEDYLLTLVPTA